MIIKTFFSIPIKKKASNGPFTKLFTDQKQKKKSNQIKKYGSRTKNVWANEVEGENQRTKQYTNAGILNYCDRNAYN